MNLDILLSEARVVSDFEVLWRLLVDTNPSLTLCSEKAQSLLMGFVATGSC